MSLMSPRVLKGTVAALAAAALCILVALTATGRFSVPGLPGGDVLVTITSTGGLCSDGPCGSKTIIRRDGHWTSESGGERTSGRADVRDLRAAIDDARGPHDFVTAKARRACPSWVDGSDVIWQLRPAFGRAIRASSCDYELRKDARLPCLLDRVEARIGGYTAPSSCPVRR